MAKKRTEYSENLKWNVKDLYETEEAYQKDFDDLEQHLPLFAKYEGHILDNADTLYKLLELDTEFSKRLEQVYIYAHINNDSDTTNVKYQTMYGKAYQLYEKYSVATSYIVPEILKSDYQLIDSYIEKNSKLKVYERTLKEIFRKKKYILSDKEEKVLSTLATTFSTPDQVYSMLSDADMKFGTIKNHLGEKEVLDEKSYHKFIESSYRKERKMAFTKLFSTYGEFKNAYASLLASEVNNNNKIANLRGYSSALEASLYSNDIPVSIYDNLINTVKKNTAPLSKFWKLKKGALGVPSLHLYDTYAPISKEVTKKYTESEAEELLYEALGALGSEYIADLRKAFQERWIDFCPNDGKRNGAYCTACYNVHPYVLLSFDGTLESVSTLAHELGHAMHYYYAIKNQSYQDYGYSIFVAEVASQVNQILLNKYLISKTTNLDEKKYLIDDLIKDFKATIYRQTMFADFERTIHEAADKGEVLTHEYLCNTYYELNKEYMGKNVIIDDLVKYEWERIPHFYMNFYVYQYATAYAAAIKIAMDILNHKEGAREQYLEFLGLGCTKTPVESLKVAGVDMTREETLKDAFVYFDTLVNELKELYKMEVKRDE